VKYTLISSKRQLTLSKEDLEKLGIDVHQRVTISFEKGALVVRPVTRTIVDEVAGVFRNDLPESKYAISVDALKSDVKKKVAQKVGGAR
jgi:bifunctional DNA-binding transcriptional regulator/antitoxin component of YhaV-PrlF toxin-antitoxin module